MAQNQTQEKIEVNSFKEKILGQDFELPDEQLLDAVKKGPWGEYLTEDANLRVVRNPEVENGGRVVIANINGFDWIVAAIRGNIFVPSDKDGKLVEGGFATESMIEFNGLVPQGIENAKITADYILEVVKSQGFINSSGFGGSLGKEVEAFKQGEVSPDDQIELQKQVVEVPLKPHRNIFDTPDILARNLKNHDDLILAGWPLTLKRAFFELNQGEDKKEYVHMIQSFLYNHHTEDIEDEQVLGRWNQLALIYRENLTEEDYSWEQAEEDFVQTRLEKGLYDPPNEYQIMRHHVRHLGFMQFNAGHTSLGLSHYRIWNGTAKESRFASAEQAINLADAFNTNLAQVTFCLLTSGNPLAWGNQISYGDSRLALRHVMGTTYTDEPIESVEGYVDRLKTAITGNYTPTISRAAYLPRDEQGRVKAAGHHAGVRIRNNFSGKNDGFFASRVEVVSPSQTWALWDDMAGDFLKQAIYLMSVISLSEGKTFKEYMEEIIGANDFLNTSLKDEYLMDYANNGQDVAWLKDLMPIWNKIFEILQKFFPNDVYIQSVIVYAKKRLQSIFFEETPSSIQEYLETRKGRAWEVIANEYHNGVSPQEIEDELIEAFGNGELYKVAKAESLLEI